MIESNYIPEVGDIIRIVESKTININPTMYRWFGTYQVISDISRNENLYFKDGGKISDSCNPSFINSWTWRVDFGCIEFVRKSERKSLSKKLKLKF
jgi:hypothetical protein